MRISSVVVGCFALAAAACGGEDAGSGLHKNGPPGAGPNAAGAPQATPPAQGGPAAPSCPADVPKSTQLATEPNVADVSFVGPSVYFRVDTHIARVALDGTARTELYKSDGLVRSYADASGILTIEADANGNTTVNLLSLDGAAAMGGAPGLPTDKGALGGNGVPVNLTAASTFIAGSDTTSFYLLDDDQDTFYRFDKQALTLTAVATLEGVVSYPQIVSGVLYYVRDQKRVFKLDLSDPTQQATPTELFGIGYDACDLAVGAYAYCSTSGVIEQRDLQGGNPKELLESAKSKIAASPFGAAVAVSDGVLVRSTTGDPALQDVIRAVGADGNEQLVACGRFQIGAMATDGKNVAWVEKEGLFAAQR